jgi:hypothetical protein
MSLKAVPCCLGDQLARKDSLWSIDLFRMRIGHTISDGMSIGVNGPVEVSGTPAEWPSR